MGRPRLSEDEKKEQIPLRVQPSLAAVLDDIARIWGEKIGKEVKRATVAREMVLIGVGVFMTLKHNKIFADFSREVDEDDQTRLAEITAKADELLSQSRNQNVDPDLILQAITQSMRSIQDALTNAPSIPAQSPLAATTTPRQYASEPLPGRKKGGRK